MYDFKWSDTEKKVARAAYDNALQKEMAAITARFKELANAVNSPDELWEIEAYLQKARKRIDTKYDYRYSRLPLLLAQLVFQNLVKREDLQKLSQDKLEIIDSLLEKDRNYFYESDQ
ncbi:hypothetical protein ACO0LL_15280 [Undibacterium sp. TC4M20W]|uniref:hypothetical protein n=1 Tax=Undibacterium sp. TC4M20W TaxID=3413052 RepID=UPI003BF130F5